MVVVSAAERGPSGSFGPLLQEHCQSAELCQPNQTVFVLSTKRSDLTRCHGRRERVS